MSFPWLVLLGVLPLLGAAVVIMLTGRVARVVGLVFALATLAVAAGVTVLTAGGVELITQVPWITVIGAWFSLGPVDGLSVSMLLLTALLTPLVLLGTWSDPDHLGRGRHWDANTYFALVLAVEGFALFTFMATDVLLFYIVFEASLVMMYFLIGGFGGEHRGRAAMKFLIFSLLGGLVMLGSIIGLYGVSAGQGQPTYLLTELAQLDLDTGVGRWIFLGFLFAFAVKAPMIGIHTWLPDAAQQGTPGGTVLLVGVLDKIGTYGMIRICLELFPATSKWAAPVLLTWAVVSIIWAALAALVQTDLYRFVAYSSISHFGFIVLGIFAFTTPSLTGATFYMFNHGLSTAALLLVLGFAVKRRGSAQMADFGGVVKVAPVLAGLTLFAGLSALALPGLSSFVSEFLVLSGTFSRHPIWAVAAVFGLVLTAAYVLTMYLKTMTGSPGEQVRRTLAVDLNGRERVAMAPLVVLIVLLGLFPAPMLDLIEPASAHTMQLLGLTDPDRFEPGEG
ncbi:NADH-quinone oxidoreductase subunit M [Naumannella halotolerans]|uniref:NADH-quinone oxidoreductase subunit M n=1 Tax=Naumannella halotolerans TaxID=993414 RepID=UPI00370D58DD